MPSAWTKWHHTTGSFTAVQFPQVEWLIEGLLPGAGWTLLVSPPKVGKSILSYQICEALALGVRLLSFPPPARAFKCAYIQVDEPQAEWQAQLKMLQAQNIPLLMPEDPEPHFLVDPVQRKLVHDALADYGAEFVVFDSAYKLAKLDLNRAHDVQLLNTWLAQVFPGPYLLLHHEHKPKVDFIEDAVHAASGHHTLAAAASAVLQVTKTGLNIAGGRLIKPRVLKLGREENGRWTTKVQSQKPGSSPGLDLYSMPA